MRKIRVLFCLASCFAFLAVAVPATDHSLAELFKTGTIRFVPEITITDEAMAGKDFFSLPMDLAVDDKGSLYVTDYQANNIKKFDAQGKFIKTIGKTGQGPGDFNGPANIEFSKGRLYVREGMNMRVSILNSDGAFIKSTAIPFDKGYWQEMKALPDGRLVIQKEFINKENLNAPQEFSSSCSQPTWNMSKRSIRGRFAGINILKNRGALIFLFRMRRMSIGTSLRTGRSSLATPKNSILKSTIRTRGRSDLSLIP